MRNKEEKENTLAVRVKGDKKIEIIKISEFISKMKKEIDEKK